MELINGSLPYPFYIIFYFEVAWKLSQMYCNIALAKRAFRLANTLDLFARGGTLKSNCLFVLFLGNFFQRCWHFLKHNGYYFSPKIWRSLIILTKVRKIIPVSYEISSSSFRWVSTWEICEQRFKSAGWTKRLEDGQKKPTSWSVSTFLVIIHSI